MWKDMLYEWKVLPFQYKGLSTEPGELSTIRRRFSTNVLNQDADGVLLGFNFWRISLTES
jgi:hypothetical protein